MFSCTVKCGIVSMCVSQIIVSAGNSQPFPRRRAVLICFPPGTPHEVSIVGGRHPIPQIRSLTVQPGSSVLIPTEQPGPYLPSVGNEIGEKSKLLVK